MYLSPKLFLFFSGVFFVESRSFDCDQVLGDVILVNVLYRHGARTPDKTYKNDPHKNAFPEGLGALNNKGKKQEFELGKWLRQRYDSLLTDTYSPELLVVRSSDKDRVIMSAQCNLAGMYPPKGAQVWNEDLDWQPIPIHTVPAELDKIMQQKAPCPAYEKEFEKVLNSCEVKERRKKDQYIIDILNKYTGEHRNDYKYISNIHDTLRVQNEYNLTLPAWSKDIFPEPMEEATVLRFTLPTWNEKLARLKSGPLISEMIKNMETKVKAESKKVMHVYAAHDTTIANLLNSLHVWDKQLPPYAACVMVELRRGLGDTHFVTLFYRPSAEEPARLLTLPGCTATCPLDDFIAITRNVVPLDWAKECQNIK